MLRVEIFDDPRVVFFRSGCERSCGCEPCVPEAGVVFLPRDDRIFKIGLQAGIVALGSLSVIPFGVRYRARDCSVLTPNARLSLLIRALTRLSC